MKLQKIGNSHMVTVPVEALKEVGWRPGKELRFKILRDALLIEPYGTTRKFPKAGVLSVPQITTQGVSKLIEESRNEH